MPHYPLPDTGTTITISEAGGFQPLPEWVDMAGLRNYLKLIWEARNAFYEDSSFGETFAENKAGEPATPRSMFQFDGHLIRATGYTGFVRFGKLTLRILPKLFATEKYSWPEVMHHLHYYLSWCRQASWPAAWTDAPPPRTGDYLQWQIGVFARFARTVLTSSPFQTYVSTTDADAFSRGRLAVDDYLREQIGTGNWQRLHNHFSDYQLDNPVNRIIRRVAVRLEPLANAENQEMLQEVLECLPGVGDAPCTAQDCDRVKANLPAGPQSRLLSLCRWFLAGTMGEDEGANGKNFFFLVPAGRVFEDFLTGFIRHHFPGWAARPQCVAYLGRSAGRPAAPVRNDLWLPEKQVVVEIKYKRIDPGPAGIPAADIYQMLAYAVARQTSTVHLIYPAPGPDAIPGFTIEIPAAGQSSPIAIFVHFVPVLLPPATTEAGYTAGSFGHLTGQLQEKLRQAIGQ